MTRKRTLKDDEKHPYRVELYFDQDDKIWIARYPELPGCLADGETREEALANGEAAKNLWLETGRENGDAIPAPYAKEE